MQPPTCAAQLRDDPVTTDLPWERKRNLIKIINLSLPYLLRTVAYTSTTEAIALMMGSLADNPIWILAVAGIPEIERG